MGDNLFRGGENSGGGGGGGGGRHSTVTMTGPAGIQAFQRFIETNCPTACVPVDLLKIARSVGIRRGGGGGPTTTTRQIGGRINHHHPSHGHHPGNVIGPAGGGDYNNGGPRLCLVVDGECCLDRVYGGFFSDWVCGGQWNRMVQFLAVLVQTVRNNNIELTVFFNGGLESQRMAEWVAAQQAERRKVSQVLRHLDAKGTPPPKVWWSAPVCLRTCLRMSLRHLEVPVVVTMDDHRQEVIAYCRENNFHGLIAEDAVYAIFDPPRYFSAQQLKLTYKGSLETKEFILDEVAKKLDLHPNRFCVFAALLGNCLLTEVDLADFYAALPIENRAKATSDTYIKAVCAYVRSLSGVDNLDAIGAQIFGGSGGGGKSRPDPRLHKFKASVKYYLNGTKDGFLRYRPSNLARKEPSHYVATWSAALPQAPQNDDELGKFASETQESEFSSLSAYKEATCNHAPDTPNILIDPSLQAKTDDALLPTSNCKPSIGPISNAPDKKDSTGMAVTRNGCADGAVGVRNGSSKSAPPQSNRTVQVNGGLLLGPSSSSSPAEISTSTHPVQPNVPGCYAPSAHSGGGYPHQPQPSFYLPTVQPEVMRTASERHQKGLMSPWILQVLTQGEFKLPVCLEEDVPSELPSSAHLYRQIRQMIYAILFNLHHLQYQVKQKQEMQSPGMSGAEETVPDILVKEWVWTKYNQFRSPDLVRAEPLGWPVPTVQRLWFGNNVDDKKRRLRAFLTCMYSDTPLMLNTSYVPQHLLVMCCVLRYVLAQSSAEMRILRNHELSAFLAQAVSPRLMDAQYMQQVQLPIVSSRSVQLASLFMRGVETALFANDACGAPIPWLMCCPWLFFDGKLLHLKLHEANESKDLLDICEGQSEQVMKVERMRQAILKGLKVEFARRTLPDLGPHMSHNHHHHHHMSMATNQFLPSGAHWPSAGRSRGNAVAGRRAVIARGGQLEIAGVVVGSWGANFGTNNRGGRGGGAGGGGGGGGSGSGGAGGSGSGGGDSGSNNNNSSNSNNNNNNNNGRGGNGGGVAPQVTSVGGPRRGKPGYIKRYGAGSSGGGGGQNWYNGAPIGRGQPSYSIRRPPAVIRRPTAVVSVQTQSARKTTNKKTGPKGGGSGGGGGVKAASNVEAQSLRKVKTSGDKSSAKLLTKAAVAVKNGATGDQFEDAGTVLNGEPKLPKSSPTIMKKPSVDEDKVVAVVIASPIIPSTSVGFSAVAAAEDASNLDSCPSDVSAAVITNNNNNGIDAAANVIVTVTVDDVVSDDVAVVNVDDADVPTVAIAVAAAAAAE